VEDEAMAKGLQDIRLAAEILASRDERLKARLTEAGERFWAANYHYDKWPSDLQEQADRIQERILADGRVKETVSAMDRATAEDVAKQILDFMVDFEVKRSEIEADCSEDEGASGS
jgi:hypothetical protein